jgi:glycerophosphoryl diester phosphodiesterase
VNNIPIKAGVLPLIIAHRGASAHAPENTLAAFQRAIDSGADGIEFDVRFANAGEVVVFHDSSLDRIAFRKEKVIQLTADELRSVDVGAWFNRKYPEAAEPEFAGEGIPTLSDTLKFLERFDGLLYIELKCREANVENLARAVCEAIRDSPLRPRIVVKSFRLQVLPFIKALCPDVRTAALFAPKIRSILRKDKHILRIAEDVGADEVSVHYTLASRKVTRKAARRDLSVIVWTADHPRWIRRGIELGLKGVITNDPAKLIAKRLEVTKAL